jgi:hypothetical protein
VGFEFPTTDELVNGILPNAYLDGNIVSVPKELLNIASLIKGKSGKSLILIYSTLYSNKVFLHRKNDDTDKIREEAFNITDRDVKLRLT